MDQMNRADTERARDFIKKKFKGCPNCGALNVQIHDIVGLPLIEHQSPSNYSFEKLNLAALPLICDNCGYIMLFAAKDILQL